MGDSHYLIWTLLFGVYWTTFPIQLSWGNALFGHSVQSELVSRGLQTLCLTCSMALGRQCYVCPVTCQHLQFQHMQEKGALLVACSAEDLAVHDLCKVTALTDALRDAKSLAVH